MGFEGLRGVERDRGERIGSCLDEGVAAFIRM